MRVPALVLLGAAVACATTPPEIGEPGAKVSDSTAEASYQAALNRVTQHREVYSELDTKFFCAATYQSADFREARVRRQATFQMWPGDEARPDDRPRAGRGRPDVRGRPRHPPGGPALRRLRHPEQHVAAEPGDRSGRGDPQRHPPHRPGHRGHARLLPVHGRLLGRLRRPVSTRGGRQAAGRPGHPGADLSPGLGTGADRDELPAGARAASGPSAGADGGRTAKLPPPAELRALRQYTRRRITPHPAPAR